MSDEVQNKVKRMEIKEEFMKANFRTSECKMTKIDEELFNHVYRNITELIKNPAQRERIETHIQNTCKKVFACRDIDQDLLLSYSTAEDTKQSEQEVFHSIQRNTLKSEFESNFDCHGISQDSLKNMLNSNGEVDTNRLFNKFLYEFNKKYISKYLDVQCYDNKNIITQQDIYAQKSLIDQFNPDLSKCNNISSTELKLQIDVANKREMNSKYLLSLLDRDINKWAKIYIKEGAKLKGFKYNMQMYHRSIGNCIIYKQKLDIFNTCDNDKFFSQDINAFMEYFQFIQHHNDINKSKAVELFKINKDVVYLLKRDSLFFKNYYQTNHVHNQNTLNNINIQETNSINIDLEKQGIKIDRKQVKANSYTVYRYKKFSKDNKITVESIKTSRGSSTSPIFLYKNVLKFTIKRHISKWFDLFHNSEELYEQHLQNNLDLNISNSLLHQQNEENENEYGSLNESEDNIIITQNDLPDDNDIYLG